MAKIDRIKETLTVLRVFFTVFVAIMVTIFGSLAGSYREGSFDILFWLGVCLEFIIMIILFFIIKNIRVKIDEIGGL